MCRLDSSFNSTSPIGPFCLSRIDYNSEVFSRAYLPSVCESKCPRRLVKSRPPPGLTVGLGICAADCSAMGRGASAPVVLAGAVFVLGCSATASTESPLSVARTLLAPMKLGQLVWQKHPIHCLEKAPCGCNVLKH